MTWSNGRQLDSTNVGGMNLSYSYNADGQRTSKSRSAYYTDEYVYYGTQLSTLIRNGVGYKHSLTFIYDDNGQALGFYYDTNLNDSNPGTKYYYVCNAQGDVLQLRDHTNAPVANYYYDSWGKLLGITDANGNAITAFNSVAVLNPIRYRGYFYDTETGFYYLNSRYYDPQIGRFINADGYVSTGQGFLDYNMFLYCGNNPTNRVDQTGMFWKEIGGFFKRVGKSIVKGIEKTVNALTKSFHFEIGMGYGFGTSFNVGKTKALATVYQDGITLGYRAGSSYTAIKGSAGFGVQITKKISLSVSTEYEHRFETDLVKDWDEHVSTSAPWSVYQCPKTMKDPFQASFPIVDPIQGDLSDGMFIGVSSSFHLGIGGHFTIGWDADVFWEELTE